MKLRTYLAAATAILLLAGASGCQNEATTPSAEALAQSEWTLDGGTFEFVDGERWHAHFGCNQINGGYEIEGETITIGPALMTRMACIDTDAGTREDAFVRDFAGAFQIEMNAQGELTLSNDTKRFTFTPKE